MKTYLIPILFIFLYTTSFAQPLDMNVPYRSKENKGYWKNKKPFEGYWQQDVKYHIQAKLDDSNKVIQGTETLTYYNNSPDVLTVVYFHLYQNAFIPGSYLGMLYKANKRKVSYGSNEAEGLGIVVESMEANGKMLVSELYNTVMKVSLPQPLKSGDSITFQIKFATYFDSKGSTRRRMKTFEHSGFKQFDGVHWYPRICVYDRYNGWDLDQHLNRELYGDYGTFDVVLSLPNQYIMEATGINTNREEVMPAELREKLNIKNFAKRTPGQAVSVPIIPDGTFKTWKFHAINIHDFAWTADPTYRISEYDYEGTQIVAIVQEENAPGWQTAALFTANVVAIYSKDFGSYGYPKLVIADARDGMEYPMMVLVGGTDPGYYFVIAHEVGHQWFYGMLGNNETYRAFMDEGFTQFLSVWSLDKLSRVYDPNFPKWREYNLFSRYLSEAANSLYPPALDTHSDHFNNAVDHGGGYSQVYYKGGTMLYNLQYVLGDTLFMSAMQHYVAQWKYAHPYPDDFRHSIIQYTGLNLSWFFDQWYKTNKIIDYGVDKVRRTQSGKDEYEIKFHRDNSGMQMPIRFTVISKSGHTYSYFIPNQPDEVEPLAQTLPAWIGWDKLNPTYTAKVEIPDGIKNVIIDTSNKLPDINLMNNSLKFPLKLKFDNGKYRSTDRRYYQAWWRPDVWYNAVDGMKIGLHIDGNYNNAARFLSATAWYNTEILKWKGYSSDEKVSFNVSYKNIFSFADNSSDWYLKARMLDGLRLGQLGFDKKFSNGIVLNLDFKAMMRVNSQYLIYPKEWEENRWNNTLNLNLTRNYNAWGQFGNYTVKLKAPALFSDYSYESITAEWKNNFSFGKALIRSRVFAGFMTGSQLANESKIFLAGANPEEMMENKFMRSKGFFPQDWYGFGSVTNHLQQGGGLNLRGYAGYLAPYLKNNELIWGNSGNAGISANLEMSFSRFIKFQPAKLKNYFSIDPYLFYDAGIIDNRVSAKQTFSPVRMDAGVGAAFTIKSWGRIKTARPLVLRFDMPFFLNTPPYDENNYWAFRWVVGVERAF